MSVSTIFFILTPFGFFCTENGTGLITGIVFLIIGLVAQWIENGGLEPKIIVKPEDWWAFHYSQFIAQGKKHKIAKGLADSITISNNYPIPSEEKKQELYKALGVEINGRLPKERVEEILRGKK